MANSSPLRAGNQSFLSGLLLQPLRDRLQHAIAAAWPEKVIDIHKSVEAKHQQRDPAGGFLRRGDHRRKARLSVLRLASPVSVVVFGEITDALGLALAHGDVAQDRAVLKTIGAVPGRETGLDRKCLAIAAPSLELHDGAAGRVPGRIRRFH